jgi:polysaccharide export outer membrane protein
MKRPTMYKHLAFLALLSALIFVSCVPHKKLLILQGSAQQDSLQHYRNDRSLIYLIQPGDNIYINVVSLDEKTALMFNGGGGSNSTYLNSDASIYLNSYTVSEVGTIEFPLAGSILVQNLTIEEVKAKLQAILDQYIKETVLVVKLVNFNVTVLGEVMRPGQYKVYKTEINLLEAISMAGDLADFANRKEVTIIRQTKNGSETKVVNLTSKEILSSPYYYLKPNDIIYVEPLKGKQFTFAEFPYAVVFSALSTLILMLNYIN